MIVKKLIEDQMHSGKDFKNIIAFLFSPKNLVLFPVMILLLLIGIFLIVTQSSAVAPLIYTLF